MLKKPRIFLQIICVSFVAGYASLLIANPVFSDTITDLQSQIDQTTQEISEKKGILADVEKKIAEISSSNYTVSQKIALIDQEINSINDDIKENTESLSQNEKDLEAKQSLLGEKKTLLDKLSSDLYIQSRFRLSTFFLTDQSWNDMVKDFFVKKNAISILKDDVEKISGDYTNLVQAKADLESQKSDLESQKNDLDQSYGLLADEKAKLQAELASQTSTKSSVTASISSLKSQLSSLQNALLAARMGGTIVNPDSVPSGSDLGSLSSFLSSAKSGTFGVFSIGAYTNRIGMSQYGAYARANAGQNYTEILSAYYPTYTLQRQAVPTTIKVQFCDPVDGKTVCTKDKKPYCNNSRIVEYNFESEYMKGIYEVSESWPYEVLKAQVIAARTYALRVTSNGANSIRADECGQVFKPQLKTGNWAKAVVETEGGDITHPYVLKNASGSYASGMFASVSGGWVTDYSTGKGWWDTTDGKGSSDLNAWMPNAWESIAKVQWFYKAWYRTGYTSGTTVNSESCYRTPWLTQTEMSDIVNMYLLWKGVDAKAKIDVSRIYPIHDACHSSGNPYTYAEVKSLINNPVISISYVVASSNNGTTSTVTFGTNRGPISISGNDFKYIYNLRAPGYLRIPQNNFVFINIQMK